MPVNYPMPSWVGPQATAIWSHIMGQGAEIGFRRAQLAQQAHDQAAKEAEFEAQQQAHAEALEQKRRHDQQELEVDAAYKTALIGWHNSDLKRREKEATAKILQTAERTAARLTLGQKLAGATTDEERAQVIRNYGIAGGVTPTEVVEFERALMNRARAPETAKPFIGPDGKPVPNMALFGNKPIRLPPPPKTGLTPQQAMAVREKIIHAHEILADNSYSPQAQAEARRNLEEGQKLLGEENVSERTEGIESNPWNPFTRDIPATTNWTTRATSPIRSPEAGQKVHAVWDEATGQLKLVTASGKMDEADDEEDLVLAEDEE